MRPDGAMRVTTLLCTLVGLAVLLPQASAYAASTTWGPGGAPTTTATGPCSYDEGQTTMGAAPVYGTAASLTPAPGVGAVGTMALVNAGRIFHAHSSICFPPGPDTINGYNFQVGYLGTFPLGGLGINYVVVFDLPQHPGWVALGTGATLFCIPSLDGAALPFTYTAGGCTFTLALAPGAAHSFSLVAGSSVTGIPPGAAILPPNLQFNLRFDETFPASNQNTYLGLV